MQITSSEFEAIIVLGGGISNSGVLTDASISRVNRALDLYQTHALPVVMSGRWSLLAEATPLQTEAAAMCDYAIRQGLPSTDVYTEEQSMDTMGNAYFTFKRYIQPRNWKNVAVVTSDFHQARSLYAFKKVLGTSVTVHILTSPNPFSPKDETVVIKREAAVFSFLRKLFDPLADGDAEGVFSILKQLSGCGSTPRYSQQQLRELLADIKRGGMYA